MRYLIFFLLLIPMLVSNASLVDKVFSENPFALRNIKKAISSWQTGCEMGNAEDCANLAWSYEDNSLGWTINLEKACKLGGSDSCWWIGHSIRSDDPYGRDKFYFIRGCNLGHKHSCDELKK